VNVQYWPQNARVSQVNPFGSRFQSVLVDLTHVSYDQVVPGKAFFTPINKLRQFLSLLCILANPGRDGKGKDGCHWKICYPGFAVPLTLLNMPVLDVKVEAEDMFLQYRHEWTSTVKYINSKKAS